VFEGAQRCLRVALPGEVEHDTHSLMTGPDYWQTVRRAVRLAASALFFFVLAGATYQGIATAVERHHLRRPGGMVDVGGHQLHIYCVGTGTPTVVLEAPAAGLSAAWGWVQPRVAKTTRTCSYDRAGLGWSERGDGPYEPSAGPPELQILLQRAGEKPPFVLAGLGLGASQATLFASQFAESVSALVLIDAPSGPIAVGSPLTDVRRMTPWLARVGVLRAAGTLDNRAAGLPPPTDKAVRAFLNRPDHLTRSAEELSRWDEITGRARSATLDPRMPIVRLEGGDRAHVAFLTTEASASPVVAAILEAVMRVRGQGLRQGHSK
jgi:pimeloyl-ACP methyl ester carboxylesterase